MVKLYRNNTQRRPSTTTPRSSLWKNLWREKPDCACVSRRGNGIMASRNRYSSSPTGEAKMFTLVLLVSQKIITRYVHCVRLYMHIVWPIRCSCWMFREWLSESEVFETFSQPPSVRPPAFTQKAKLTAFGHSSGKTQLGANALIQSIHDALCFDVHSATCSHMCTVHNRGKKCPPPRMSHA